jgi:hypothetical protein
MPCIEIDHDYGVTDPLRAVMRLVEREEMMNNPDARHAMQRQWAIMHRRAWDFNNVREKSEVIAESENSDSEIYIGKVQGLCFEANYELPTDHPSRHYRGHLLFTDCDTIECNTPNKEIAVMPWLGGEQVTLENQRLLDCYGACAGNASEHADGVQI